MNKFIIILASIILFTFLIMQNANTEDEKKESSSSPGSVTESSLSDDSNYLENQKEKAIKKKEAKLESKELELLEKEKFLNKLKSEIEAESKNLIQIQNNITKMMDKISTENAQKVDTLAKIFEGMKADNAASVIVELYKKDIDITIEVIKKLQPRKSGKIMDAMTKIDKVVAADISYRISKKQKFK